MTRFICGGEKYRLGGSKLDSICLIVSAPSLPETIEVEGSTFLLKSEFHVTLISPGKIAAKHGITEPNFLEKITAEFCAFVRDNPVEFLRYRDEFRLVAQNERRTVVVMCDISNLGKFFDQLNGKYDLKLDYPPTHVTLYTLQPNIGIFLTDSNDIEKLTKIIPGLVTL